MGVRVCVLFPLVGFDSGINFTTGHIVLIFSIGRLFANGGVGAGVFPGLGTAMGWKVAEGLVDSWPPSQWALNGILLKPHPRPTSSAHGLTPGGSRQLV